MKTIFITSGHSIVNGRGTGAISSYGDEAVEARKFVTDLSKLLYQRGIMAYTDNDKWSLIETINWLGTKVKKVEYTIDVHFNAFTNPTGTGAEVLVANDANEKEIELAAKISKFIAGQLNIPNRGVKKESDSQHSKLGILSSNKLSTANNILIELCFISNPEDMRKYRYNYNVLLSGIADIINQTLK